MASIMTPSTPLLPSDLLLSLSLSQTQDLLATASRHFGLKSPQVIIRFDLRGRSAGQVRLGAGGVWVVRYNPALLARHGEDFLSKTIPHEVAHVIAYRLHGPGILPHGPEWRALMCHFGADPTRCHDFDISGLPTRTQVRFSYQCACRTHQLTSIRHHRILRGQRYQCRTCGQDLTRISEEHSG